MKSKRNSALFLRLLYGLAAGLLLGISALVVYLFQDQARGQAAVHTGHFIVESELEFDGALPIEPPVDLPDFTLTKQDGGQFSSRELRGRYALLTFGFSNCHDICPLTLNDFQQVHNLLGDSAGQLEFLFISVDGRRDSPSVLRRFFASHDLENIIGLTGAEAEVREIGAPLGLSFEIVGDAASDSYAVNHSTGSFLLDERGRWIRRFQFGLPPQRIAAELRQLLS